MAELSAPAEASAINGTSRHRNGKAVINGIAALKADGQPESLTPAVTADAAAPPAGTSVAAKPDDAAPPSPGVTPAAKPADVSVCDIRKHQTDCRGETIDFVFFRRPDYAIYRSDGNIMVQYSDNETTAKAQVGNTADLLPLRGKLQYLMKDMEAPHAYYWQIAEALRLGLDGQRDAAKSTMQAAIDDILARRMSQGRTLYLAWAGSVAGLVACGAGAAAIWFLLHAAEFTPGLSYLMMATGAGAMGSLLSAAQALRARAICGDADRMSNAVDSSIRILIGVISGAALYLILDSNLLATFSLGTKGMDASTIWKAALLTGFVAGFLERLVPDLLENKVAGALAK